MVTIGMNYAVLSGKEKIFEDAFDRVLSAMKEREGHAQTRLYKEVGGTGSYLIVSEWTDREAFGSFVRSDAFTKVTQWGKDRILSERPRHHIYTSEEMGGPKQD